MKLRREVLHVLGCTGKPIYGTLRLHPPVLINMRQALETTTIPGAPGEPGFVLLESDSVTILTIGMHTRQGLYLSPSEKFAPASHFSPDRWVADAVDIYALPRRTEDLRWTELCAYRDGVLLYVD